MEINEKIGNGGSGCVVHACQVDGWQCALKVLSTDGVSVNQVTQFEKEGLVLTYMFFYIYYHFSFAPILKSKTLVLFLESLPPHRNLVQYLHHERTRGSIRLYMRFLFLPLSSFYLFSLFSQEFFRRYYSTLRSFMQSLPEPLSRKDLTGICLDVAVGLSILHKNKIIHRFRPPFFFVPFCFFFFFLFHYLTSFIQRDLKTDNLFVTLDGMGAYSYCSVGDFDSAKRLSAGVKAKTVCPLFL